jgi:hypothetical protein
MTRHDQDFGREKEDRESKRVPVRWAAVATAVLLVTLVEDPT